MENELNNIFIDILMATGLHGGVENVVNRLGLYLKKQGFKVRVCQLIFEGDRWTDEELEFVHALDSRNNMDLEKMYQGYKHILLESDQKPSVILATAWPYMSYIAKRATQELGIKAPVIGYPHVNPFRYEEAGYGSIDMFANADICLAISDMIRQDILEALPDSFVYRVNNPLPNSKVLSIDTSARNPLHIAYIGRLSPEKMPDLLIKAIALCKHPYHLYMVGTGEMLSNLKKLTKELGISKRIHFLGWKEDPWQAVNTCSLSVMASVSEGFSLTATESMSRGIGLISTPVSGSVELIEPGVTGYLFPQQDYKELANILDKIADNELPLPDYSACINASLPFIPDIALFDTMLKIYATAKYKYLPSKEFVQYKISVVIPITDEIPNADDALDSIINQSIGMDMMELIFVDTKTNPNLRNTINTIEQTYPNNVLIIECDSSDSLSPAEVGASYASGDYSIELSLNQIINKTYLASVLINALV